MTPATGPVLALAPGTPHGPGTGANTGPRPGRSRHPYRKSCSCPACVLHFQFTDERIFAALHHAGYNAWLGHVWHAAACTRPIKLRGDIRHIDPATGELLRTIPTLGMPDGVIYKPCGNRRATICPGCAEAYRRDAYQLIRAGLVGGKGIPRRRHPPGPVRHVHRPVLRARPRPAGPHPHLRRQDPLHLPAAALPCPP